MVEAGLILWRGGTGDLSVSGWNVQALKGAQLYWDKILRT